MCYIDLGVMTRVCYNQYLEFVVAFVDLWFQFPSWADHWPVKDWKYHDWWIWTIPHSRVQERRLWGQGITVYRYLPSTDLAATYKSQHVQFSSRYIRVHHINNKPISALGTWMRRELHRRAWKRSPPQGAMILRPLPDVLHSRGLFVEMSGVEVAMLDE